MEPRRLARGDTVNKAERRGDRPAEELRDLGRTGVKGVTWLVSVCCVAIVAAVTAVATVDTELDEDNGVPVVQRLSC